MGWGKKLKKAIAAPIKATVAVVEKTAPKPIRHAVAAPLKFAANPTWRGARNTVTKSHGTNPLFRGVARLADKWGAPTWAQHSIGTAFGDPTFDYYSARGRGDSATAARKLTLNNVGRSAAAFVAIYGGVAGAGAYGGGGAAAGEGAAAGGATAGGAAAAAGGGLTLGEIGTGLGIAEGLAATGQRYGLFGGAHPADSTAYSDFGAGTGSLDTSGGGGGSLLGGESLDEVLDQVAQAGPYIAGAALLVAAALWLSKR